MTLTWIVEGIMIRGPRGGLRRRLGRLECQECRFTHAPTLFMVRNVHVVLAIVFLLAPQPGVTWYAMATGEVSVYVYVRRGLSRMRVARPWCLAIIRDSVPRGGLAFGACAGPGRCAMSSKTTTTWNDQDHGKDGHVQRPPKTGLRKAYCDTCSLLPIKC